MSHPQLNDPPLNVLFLDSRMKQNFEFSDSPKRTISLSGRTRRNVQITNIESLHYWDDPRKDPIYCRPHTARYVYGVNLSGNCLSLNRFSSSGVTNPRSYGVKYSLSLALSHANRSLLSGFYSSVVIVVHRPKNSTFPYLGDTPGSGTRERVSSTY